jgi:DNA repair protein RadC
MHETASPAPLRTGSAMRDHKPIDPSAACDGDLLLAPSCYHRDLDDVPDAQILSLLLLPVSGPGDHRLVAERLLQAFGSLGAVLSASVERLTEHTEECAAYHIHATHVAFKRVLREKIDDKPLIGSWADLEEYLLVAFRHENIEQIVVFFLDRNNHLIGDEILARGTVDHVFTYPREVVARALRHGASAVIMIHTRPSDDPTPSEADVHLSRQVTAALATLGIAMHDHAIVGKNRVVSLRSQRLI